jgi:hypothetical protein
MNIDEAMPDDISESEDKDNPLLKDSINFEKVNLE